METTVICPRCHIIINPTDYFCSNCGEKLKNDQNYIPTGRIITIYLVSFFLPPAGFYYGFKYLKQTDEKIRKIGKIAVILTCVSLVITILTLILGIKIARDLIKLTTQDLPSDFINYNY